MSDVKITLACWNYDRTRALMDGSVKPDGIELRYENLFPADNFPRMMRDREFEAAELGLTFYLATLHLDDPPFVAIPVYPIRIFCHSAIYINTNSGIEEPKDLIGKRIGEFFLYGHDAGTWSKGILSDHYGVPIDSYSNYIGGVEHPTPPLEWYPLKPPSQLSVQHIGTGTTLDAMLDAGEIDALFSALVPASLRRKSKNVRRLFPDFEAAERSYFRQTGIFPIQHIVAIRKDVYQKHPWVALSLYKAFCAAKERCYRMLLDAGSPKASFAWLQPMIEEEQRIFGKDWYSYGVEANRPTLEAVCQYTHEHALTFRRLKIEELFAPSTMRDIPLGEGQHV